ncbi:crossover junction endodeoxyribonuclease RuvC [Nitriliruptoraceae bacterium ZYF776]|nr:crossover junction endodeoxyribonuclease RuvC [Profundirhabdus halotolerans]
MRVLGVDPGLTRCGLGVVAGPSAEPRLVDARCVRTDKDLPHEQRLLAVHDAIVAAIETHRPDAVAVERVLFSVNVRSAMATGQAAGVALLAAARAGVPVHPYSPSDVKLTVAGSGTADKRAVGQLVAAHLRLDAPPTPADVADALAVALTHLAKARLVAAAAATPASDAVARAHADAARSAKGGWERVLADRGLTVRGGAGRSGAADTRATGRPPRTTGGPRP